MLDRLVRRAVLAEADRIVRVYEDRAELHERRHAQRVPRVVGEGEERPHVRDEAAVQCEAVGDGAHAELAHAEVEVIAGRPGRDHLAARPVREDGTGQVGRAADHLRQYLGIGLDRLLRRLARGNRLALRGLRRHESAHRLREAARQVARDAA
jgi:hypothetical protein